MSATGLSYRVSLRGDDLGEDDVVDVVEVVDVEIVVVEVVVVEVVKGAIVLIVIVFFREPFTAWLDASQVSSISGTSSAAKVM